MQSCELAFKNLPKKLLVVDFGAAPAETTLGFVDPFATLTKSSNKGFFNHLLATESTHHFATAWPVRLASSD